MTPSTGTRTDFEPVARLADVPPGALQRVVLSDGTAVCVGNHAGALFALRDLCTHAAFPLSAGHLTVTGAVECGWHGAQFDCRTGAAGRAPAGDAVDTFDTFTEDGHIWVRPVPRP